MTRVFVVGAGGFGVEVASYVLDLSRTGQQVTLAGFVDDGLRPGQPVAGVDVRVVGGTQDCGLASDARFVVAIGHPGTRSEVSQRLARRGAEFIALVHPRSYVSETAAVGPGCVVAPFAFVGPRARLEQGVALNVHVSVGHDAEVGAYSVLSPFTAISGHAVLGARVFIGSHGTLVPRAVVEQDAVVSAGAVVYRRVPAGMLAFGNPARNGPVAPRAGTDGGAQVAEK
jgi:sugar O-acyltransferase (sialic acid O-acetyltransferase NeuD family)